MLTLSSDFGWPYPAAMRGVILSRTRGDLRLVDVTHNLPRGDVRAAAFWLREVLPWFPPAVHIAVVDPGVGTDRAALVVRVGDHALVGPDNGSLLPPARRLAANGSPQRTPAASDPGSSVSLGADPDADVEVFEYEYEAGAPASTTFHGRDVFAPAAAAVHDAGVEGLEILDCVVPASGYEEFRFPAPTRRKGGADGEVLVVDGFGNVVTNVPGAVLDGRDAVDVNGEMVPVATAYAAVDAGARLATVGSHGNVELAVNDGRGDAAFELAPGDAVALDWSSERPAGERRPAGEVADGW